MAKYEIDGVPVEHSKEEGNFILFSKTYGKLASFTRLKDAMAHEAWLIKTRIPHSMIEGIVVKNLVVYELRGHGIRRQFIKIDRDTVF